jgi:hypothetical protein
MYSSPFRQALPALSGTVPTLAGNPAAVNIHSHEDQYL